MVNHNYGLILGGAFSKAVGEDKKIKLKLFSST